MCPSMYDSQDVSSNLVVHNCLYYWLLEYRDYQSFVSYQMTVMHGEHDDPPKLSSDTKTENERWVH